MKGVEEERPEMLKHLREKVPPHAHVGGKIGDSQAAKFMNSEKQRNQCTESDATKAPILPTFFFPFFSMLT
jgi:hypothetical protein